MRGAGDAPSDKGLIGDENLSPVAEWPDAVGGTILAYRSLLAVGCQGGAMSDPNSEQQKDVVDQIVKSLSAQEQEQLLRWAQDLQAVRNSRMTVLDKGKKALAVTRQNQALAPIVKSLLRELRRIGWDDRTWIGRLGISGSILGLLLLNTATGGFAAFGTAIAVPLWLVVGGGGLLLGLLIETLKKKLAAKDRGVGS